MPNVTSVVLRSQSDGRRSDQLASVTMILPAWKRLPLPTKLLILVAMELNATSDQMPSGARWPGGTTATSVGS
jgi:hypothetical protein